MAENSADDQQHEAANQAEGSVKDDTLAQETGTFLLEKQHFSGNPLDRQCGLLQRFTQSISPDKEVSLVVVSGREIVVRQAGPEAQAAGVQQDLQALLLPMDDPELDLQGEELALNWSSGE